MTTRSAKLLTLALWVIFAAYCAGFAWHKHRHPGPCADVHGKLVTVNGERMCEVSK
jgi:hypothetical protein